MYKLLNYFKNKNLWINKILDVATKFQSNMLKPTRSTCHPYDPSSEQTKNVDG
jgi:hypothetical protein